MTDYERLTRYMQVGNKVVQVIPQRKERIQAYIDRLFDLEDKIESSELISKKEVERLQNENAALCERLDKAVVLPCKIGDKVYYLSGSAEPVHIEEATVTAMEVNISNKRIFTRLIFEPGNYLCPIVENYLNKSLFFDRVAAEVRLKELQGEKQ